MVQSQDSSELRDTDNFDTELSSLNSQEELISDEQDVASYPYQVMYQQHEITINSLDIKESRFLQFQYLTLSLCYLVFGLSDSTVGTVIPSLIEEYGIDHSQLSYLFSAQFFGYLASSLLSNYIITSYGFYGAMLSCQVSSMMCYYIVFMKPPFAIIVMSYILAGFGAGVLDSTSNVWVGRLKYCNQLLGLIHAEYGLGGMISPVVITRMINHGISWIYYYLFLALLSTGTTISIAVFFKTETKWKHKYLSSLKTEGEDNDDVSIGEVLRNKLVWFFSMVLFIYVGGELAIGSWIYNYLLVIKLKLPSTSSYITSTYWLFMTLGRIVLGFVIGHWFETRELTAVVMFCSIIATGSFIFTVCAHWLYIQVMSIMIIGFFVGPMFPTIVVVALKYLPSRLETAGVGTLVAMGGGGALVIPYLIGLISKVRPNGGGLVWFPFVMLTVFGTDAICFLIFYLTHRN